jgi:type I restriction enzyme S subunit
VRQFELLATAPGGVARLREFILSLAVQGKLTAQDCDEEPASALLERIHDRKLRSIASGAIKQGKQPAELDDAEPMFELPKGWTWTRLGELCSYIQRGKGPAYAEHSEHKVISQKCVRWYGLDLAPARFVTAESLAKYEPVRLLRAGDLLWNSTGTGTIGRACVVPIELDDAGLVADSHVTVVRPLEVNSVFLWRWIQSPFVQNEIEGSASGTTNQIELNTSTVVNQPVPLPTLAEQARIVARVDELMQLCDALEAKGLLEAQQHARLLEALLGTLTDSATPEELAANWQRVAEHFDLLLDRPEAVDMLEQTVLQLAVRGLLVPQDPSDKPVTEFISRGNVENRRKGSGADIEKARATPSLIAGQYEVPDGWIWTNIESIASVGTGTTPSRDNSSYFVDGTVPWVTSGETGQALIRRTAQHVTELALSQTSLKIYEPGTLILAMYGQGKTRGQVAELCVAAATNQACAAIALFENSAAHRSYIKLVLEKGYDEIRALSAGGAQPNLNVAKVKATLVPLPPLSEQARIVARVTELRGLCTDLRHLLAASLATQSRLVEALVATEA